MILEWRFGFFRVGFSVGGRFDGRRVRQCWLRLESCVQNVVECGRMRNMDGVVRCGGSLANVFFWVLRVDFC